MLHSPGDVQPTAPILLPLPPPSPLLALLDLLQGNVSAGDVFTVLPFGNTLALKKMSGASLLSSLEWGVSALGTTAGTGRFPQV